MVFIYIYIKKYIKGSNLCLIHIPAVANPPYYLDDKFNISKHKYVLTQGTNITKIGKNMNIKVPIGTEYCRVRRHFLVKLGGKWYFRREVKTSYLVCFGNRHIPINRQII